MEMIVDSEISVPDICKVSLLPSNYAGVIGSHRVEISPSNSLKNAKKMNFILPPTLPSELYGPNSELICSFKLKKDGSTYGYVCVCVNVEIGMCMTIRCSCPPVHNDIVTPHYLFYLLGVRIKYRV